MAYSNITDGLKSLLSGYSEDEEKLSSLYKTALENAEKAHADAMKTLESEYISDRNRAVADTMRDERNTYTLLAERGLGFSGEAAQTKLNSNILLSNRLGALGTEYSKNSNALQRDLADKKFDISLQFADKASLLNDKKNQFKLDIAKMEQSAAEKEADRRFQAEQLKNEQDFQRENLKAEREWKEHLTQSERAWQELQEQYKREWEAQQSQIEREWEEKQTQSEREWKEQQAEKEHLYELEYQKAVQEFEAAQKEAQRIWEEKQAEAERVWQEKIKEAERIADKEQQEAELLWEKEKLEAQLQAEYNQLMQKLQAEKEMKDAELYAKYYNTVGSTGGSGSGSGSHGSSGSSSNQMLEDILNGFKPEISAKDLAKLMVTNATENNKIESEEDAYLINKYLLEMHNNYNMDSGYLEELVFMLKAYGYNEATVDEMRMQVISHDAAAYYDARYSSYYERYALSGASEADARQGARMMAKKEQMDYIRANTNGLAEFMTCCLNSGISESDANKYALDYIWAAPTTSGGTSTGGTSTGGSATSSGSSTSVSRPNSSTVNLMK